MSYAGQALQHNKHHMSELFEMTAHLDSSYPSGLFAMTECPPFLACNQFAALWWLFSAGSLRMVAAGKDCDNDEDY